MEHLNHLELGDKTRGEVVETQKEGKDQMVYWELNSKELQIVGGHLGEMWGGHLVGVGPDGSLGIALEKMKAAVGRKGEEGEGQKKWDRKGG